MIRYTLALFSMMGMLASAPVFAEEPPAAANQPKGFISLKNVRRSGQGAVAMPIRPSAVGNFMPLKPRATTLPATKPAAESSEMTPEKAHLLLSMFTIPD